MQSSLRWSWWRGAFGVVALVCGVAPVSAQTQVNPRVLLIVDTSGSMTQEANGTGDTGADGSALYRSGLGLDVTDFGRGYATTANSCSVTTYRGIQSRMYAAKTAVSNVVNATGDIDWGLARYAGQYCDVEDHPVDDCGGNNECRAASSCCRADRAQAGACTNTGNGTRACRCLTNADCFLGQQCMAVPGRSHLTCVTVEPYYVTCGGNGDCTSNNCSGGACACTSNNQCNTNEFCVGGFCRVDSNLCWITNRTGHQDGLYGITDQRAHPGTCEDHLVLPLSYAGSCGDTGTGTSLGNNGCRSPYTCSSNAECAPGRTCAPIPAGVVANSGATACTCNNNADCAGNLPVDSAGRRHVGFTCQSGMCVYTEDTCRGNSATMIVNPIAPSPPQILLWMNQREDYNSTTNWSTTFSTPGTPVDTINVLDPELRAQGATPLGGSLRSAAAWYNGIKTANSDAKLACRPYITVLLTDGADTCEGNDEQNEWGPPAAARKFVAETVASARVPNKVFVIGLSVTDTADRNRLNAVAYAGGTTTARFVSSSAEIEVALADILAESILFEKCNGVDDDCDGLIDEGFGVYKECTGTTNCNAGRTTCGSAGQPACGTGYSCTGGFCVATCSAGQGSCQRDGVRQCAADGTARCSATAGAPGSETTPIGNGCNNIDDNCDGVIDNCTGLSPNSCTCGGCSGTPEICNGLDDDCVGGIDNNPVDVGLPCGQGVCAGTTVCTGGMLSCNGAAPGTEACNNLDDDCDGVVDNYTEKCPAVPGQCDPGVRTCVAGAFGGCTGIVNGTAEICNGLDDDCDGTIDESPTDPWVGQACCPTGNAADCCVLGTFQCVGGMQRCNGAVVKQAEVCDGLDNDCNGMTDDVTGIGQACTSSNVVTGGACRAEYQCLATPGTGPLGLTCVQIVGPSGEVCDGLDNDCNGTIDDNITNATDPRVGVEGGAPCMALPDGQMMPPCKPGTTVCVAGMIECSGYVGPQPNLCDGISRDCTGVPNTAGNCPVGFECFQGNCVAPCAGGEFPCLGGFICVDGLCIPDACSKANCPAGQLCELADDGTAVCKDPCENTQCSEGQVCELGVCKDTSCKTAGCPDGEICSGSPPSCVPDPCADKICETNEYCDSTGACVRLCEQVCLDGTVCINGTCQIDPCAGKSCGTGEICVVQNGAGVCVESLCGNDCGGSGRVCCGATCRPDPCMGRTCPVNAVCTLDPQCAPQCVIGNDNTPPVQIVGAGGGGVGCAAAGDPAAAGGVSVLVLLASIIARVIARRRRARAGSTGMIPFSMDEGA